MPNGRLQKIENNKEFQTISPKTSLGRLQEVVAYGRVLTIPICQRYVWYLRKWSFIGGVLLRE